jgi:hypothetical protein
MRARVVSVVLGAVVALAVWGVIGVPDPARAGDDVVGCSEFDMPYGAAYQIEVDLDTGLMRLAWSEIGANQKVDSLAPHNEGPEREAVIDFRSKDCLSDAAVRNAIDIGLSAADQQLGNDCAFMKEFLASDDTTVRGIDVNRAAGDKFVRDECNKGSRRDAVLGRIP